MDEASGTWETIWNSKWSVNYIKEWKKILSKQNKGTPHVEGYGVARWDMKRPSYVDEVKWYKIKIGRHRLYLKCKCHTPYIFSWIQKRFAVFIQADTKELVLKDWSYTNHVLSNWSADAWAPIHNKFHPNVFQLSSFNSSRAVVERIKQSCILLFPRLQIPSTNVTFRIWVVSSHVPTTPSLEFICRGYQLR